MSLMSSPEHTALRTAVADLMAKHSTEEAVRAAMASGTGFDPALWQQMAAMGLLGLAIPQRHGGTGAGPVELGIAAEEMGRALWPAPTCRPRSWSRHC